MIDRTYGGFELNCDICGDSADESFDEFAEAVQFKKDEGWKSRKINGEWHDICPECVGKQ